MVDDGSRFFSHWFPKDIRSARDIWIALGLSPVPTLRKEHLVQAAGVEKAPKPFQRPKRRDQGRGQAFAGWGCLERQIWHDMTLQIFAVWKVHFRILFSLTCWESGFRPLIFWSLRGRSQVRPATRALPRDRRSAVWTTFAVDGNTFLMVVYYVFAIFCLFFGI